MPNPTPILPETPRLIGIAADHGGYELKQYLIDKLHEAGHKVIDFGDREQNPVDDYPDFVVPLARAIASGDVEQTIRF
jgi:ribose 5-phosphate isomerase B